MTMTIAAETAANTPTDQTKTQIVQLKNLTRHKAHDRTKYDLPALVGLTLQIVERQLDKWQPIVVTESDALDQHAIISGRRRFLATVLSYGVQEWAKAEESEERKTDGQIEMEVGDRDREDRGRPALDLAFTEKTVTEMITALAGEYANHPLLCVEEAVRKLLELYGENEIEVVVFDGDKKAEILALQAANANREDPDMLGLANSYKAAMEAGATPAEIARNSGVSVEYVLNHLALTTIPELLVDEIAAGHIAPTVARQLSRLSETQAEGVAHYLAFAARKDAKQVTVKRVQSIVTRLKKWQGITVPMTGFTKQSHRNIARILASIWQKTVTANPADAWQAAAAMAADALLDEAWLSPHTTVKWIQLLTGYDYINTANGGKPKWNMLVKDHLMLDCATCPLSQLPQERTLENDLGNGNSDVTGMPCRVGHPTPCLHGYAPNDPLNVPVPWEWANHAGVEKTGGAYRITTKEALLTAWNAQKAQEDAAMFVVFADDALTFTTEIDSVPKLSQWRTFRRKTADGTMGYFAERQTTAESEDEVSMMVVRTPTCRSVTDVMRCAEAQRQLTTIPLADYQANPTTLHMPVEIDTIRSGDFPAASDRVVEASELPDAAALQTAHPHWTLHISIRPNLLYFYATHRQRGLLTHGHDTIQAVATDIERIEQSDKKGKTEQNDGSGDRPASTAPDMRGEKREKSHHRAIRTFMATHEQFASGHPFATPCATCRHKMDKSPIKSHESAPHCAWAKGARRLSFTLLQPAESEHTEIPVCRQYAPSQTWREIIPAYQGTVAMPRQWIAERIRWLVKSAPDKSRYASSFQRKVDNEVVRHTFEFLTGRPFKKSESHSNWFLEQFETNIGELSDEQLWTLLVWAFTEHERVSHSDKTTLPANGASSQFIPISEVVYPAGDEGDEDKLR